MNDWDLEQNLKGANGEFSRRLAIDEMTSRNRMTLGEMIQELEAAGYVVISPDSIDASEHSGSCPHCERPYLHE